MAERETGESVGEEEEPPPGSTSARSHPGVGRGSASSRTDVGARGTPSARPAVESRSPLLPAALVVTRTVSERSAHWGPQGPPQVGARVGPSGPANTDLSPGKEDADEPASAGGVRGGRPRQSDAAATTTRGGFIHELREQNAKLRRELEHLRGLKRAESVAGRLRQGQTELQALQDKVNKLQGEVTDRRTTHAKEWQRQQAELRRLVQQCEASRAAVQRVRDHNQALRQRAEQAERKGSPTSPGPPGPAALAFLDVQAKLDKARERLRRAEQELTEKRRHPKKVLCSADSLEVLRDLWSDHVTLLEELQRRETKRDLMRDRVNMFTRNIDILRGENQELATRLRGAHEQLQAFVEQPMTPTAFVERNVALLKHMEKIEATLAEKAVELDEQEKALKLEQHRVRELLVTLEGLRRENRHLNRRLRKAQDAAHDQQSVDGGLHGAATASPPSGQTSRDNLQLADRWTPLGSQNLSMLLMATRGQEGDRRLVLGPSPRESSEATLRSSEEQAQAAADSSELEHASWPRRVPGAEDGPGRGPRRSSDFEDGQGRGAVTAEDGHGRGPRRSSAVEEAKEPGSRRSSSDAGQGRGSRRRPAATQPASPPAPAQPPPPSSLNTPPGPPARRSGSGSGPGSESGSDVTLAGPRASSRAGRRAPPPP